MKPIRRDLHDPEVFRAASVLSNGKLVMILNCGGIVRQRRGRAVRAA
jgi:hypothetical protein